MVYAPVFITTLQEIVDLSFGSITLAQLNDSIVEMGENRVILDLSAGHHYMGSVTVTYQDLLSLDRAWFSRALKYAAIYAILSYFNKHGVGNTPVGPIVSASGDGMAMTSSYYNSKTVSSNALVTAEEDFLNQMRQIYMYYNAKRTKTVMASQYNEKYDGYSPNDQDRRYINGNPI